MAFQIQSKVESETPTLSEDVDSSQSRIERWAKEKGYFSQTRITDAIDERIRSMSLWPAGGEPVRSTFSRICNEGGHGISSDKFIAEFDNVLDTSLPYVRRAIEMIRVLLLFFSHFPFEVKDSNDDETYMDVKGFQRALCVHTELNPLFNVDFPRLVDSEQGNREGSKVHTDPMKTASDLRRLLFRGLASTLPQHSKLEKPTHVPVLQFVWHEHKTGTNGEPINVEHRIFELEDERTVELQDILAMSRTRIFRITRPYSRDAFKTILPMLPHFQHDLQQLGIERQPLACLITLLSCIDPDQPGLRMTGSLPQSEKRGEEWLDLFPDTQGYLGYVEFDKLLREQLPHFDIQLSKLIGLLAVERSADGSYKGETDPTKIALPPDDRMQHRLRQFTVSDRFDSRELDDTLMVNMAEAGKPLWSCSKCRELGLDDDDD